MRDAVFERVRSIVGAVAGPSRTPADATEDTPLAAAGFWLDSLEILEVVLACEREFAVTFDADTELVPKTLRTVGGLAGMVRTKQRA